MSHSLGFPGHWVPSASFDIYLHEALRWVTIILKIKKKSKNYNREYLLILTLFKLILFEYVSHWLLPPKLLSMSSIYGFYALWNQEGQYMMQLKPLPSLSFWIVYISVYNLKYKVVLCKRVKTTVIYGLCGGSQVSKYRLHLTFQNVFIMFFLLMHTETDRL